MNKIDKSRPPGALDGKIAATLDDGKTASSHDLEALVAEIQVAIEDADRDAQREREASLDPIVSPTDAAERASCAVVSELRRSRYQTAKPRIEQKLRLALESEYHDRWLADRGKVENKVDQAANKLRVVRDYQANMARIYEKLDYELSETWRRS